MTKGGHGGISNTGTITANGGEVILSAKAAGDLFKTVINNQGVIEAKTIENKNGVIKLLGGMENNAINVGGTLDASALDGGDGGFIETSAAKVNISDDAKITTYAPNGKTGIWLIDPQDYTIAASGRDITGSTLSANLGSSSITILSSDGATLGNGDIFVNDAVSWSTNNILTLSAYRNVKVNSNITATGNTAGLVLTPDTCGGACTGTYSLNNGAVITLSGTTPSLTIAGNAYTVINSLGAAGSTTGTDLQGMSGNLFGYYALGSSAIWRIYEGSTYPLLKSFLTPLTVTANNASKTYGDANPTLTATYTGLKGTDTSSVVSGLTLNTTAAASSNAGAYTIIAADGTAANYTITFNNGTLTINPAASTASSTASAILDIYQIMDTENITDIKNFNDMIALGGTLDAELFTAKALHYEIEQTVFGYQPPKGDDSRSDKEDKEKDQDDNAK